MSTKNMNLDDDFEQTDEQDDIMNVVSDDDDDNLIDNDWNDDEIDYSDEEIEEVENQIKSKNDKRILYIAGAVGIVVVVLLFLFQGAKNRNDQNKQPEEVVVEQTTQENEQSPDDVEIENVTGDLEQIEVEETKEEETKEESTSPVSSESTKNREQSSHQYPEYPSDAEIVDMDMKSLEIYNMQGSGSYITILVGDINGNRAYINLDKSLEGCNDDLSEKLDETDNKILLARLQNYLETDSNSSNYDDVKKNYISKYIEFANKANYVLKGYKSDYKHSSLNTKEETKKEETASSSSNNSSSGSSNNSSSSSSSKNNTKPTSTTTTSSKNNSTTSTNSNSSISSSPSVVTDTQSSTVSSITIEYALDGGINHSDNVSSVTTAAIDKFELKAPTKEGYNFIGWYKDASLSEKFEKLSTTDTKVVLYAKWNRVLSSIIGPSETVILDKNGNYNIKDYITTSPVNYTETLVYKSSSSDITVDENGNIKISGYKGGTVSILSSNNLTAEVKIVIDHVHEYETDVNGKTCVLCGYQP